MFKQSICALCIGAFIGTLLGFNISVIYNQNIPNIVRSSYPIKPTAISNFSDDKSMKIRSISRNTEEEYLWCWDILNSYRNDTTNSYGLHYKDKGRSKRGYNFASQYHQDWMLYSAIFINMKHKGIYMDLASYHYRSISNTFFIDKCLSFDGFCIEPEKMFWNALHQRRNCILIKNCVWSEPKQLIYEAGGGLGIAGLEGFNKMQRWGRKVTGRVTMNCTTIQDIVDKYNVSHIDYLSLDIEGSELHALKGIDFSKLQIDIISVEGNDENDIVEFLTENGYILMLVTVEDFIFIHVNAPQKLKWMSDWIQNAHWKSVGDINLTTKTV